MFIFSAIQTFYVTTFAPIEDDLIMRLDLFNECTAVVLVALMPIFSDFNLNAAEATLEADVLFLIVLCINLLVHLFFLLRESISDCRLKCRKRAFKKDMKKRKALAKSLKKS